jgi:hypothetical protein
MYDPQGPQPPMTHEICMQICSDRGYKLAGLEYSDQCFCGDTINPRVPVLTNASSDCLCPCKGDPLQKCGGWWQVTVLNYTCSGVPDGGAPMALITPCENEEVGNYKWTWYYDALTDPQMGSTICMQDWDGHCLAAEADHERARLVVTRNGDKW